MPAAHFGDFVEDGADTRFVFGRQALVRELARRFDDHAPPGAEDDARDEDGDDGVEPRPARQLHEQQADEDADRRPDVGRQVQAVRFERLRARDFRDVEQPPRDGEVDDDGHNHDGDAVAERLGHFARREFVDRLVDDADSRADNQQRLDGRREVFIFPMPIVVLEVGRRVRLAHGPERDECRDEVRARMERLRDEADGADVEPDDELQHDERRI